MANETLNLLKTALEGVDDHVFYGTAAKLPHGAPWNYTVFSREPTIGAANVTRLTDHYLVACVRENFVPEGLLEQFIDAVCKLPGFKVDWDRDVEYVYQVKPGTTQTVEMMTVRFARARKGTR